MQKKIVEIEIIFFVSILLIGSCNPLSMGVTESIDNVSSVVFNGNILYVGGSGPGNYSTIQDAIDDAAPGDTVFVYDDSSPYHENVRLYKSITLTGEMKETTIIDGAGDYLPVIEISANGTTIHGFTFTHADIGIFGSSNKSVISDNIFILNQAGIALISSSNNTISNNIVTNQLYYNEVGITFYYLSDNNTISHNSVSKSYAGIYLLSLCKKNKIVENNLSNNYYGVLLEWVLFNTVEKNNFIENNVSASFSHSILNRWIRNYWDDWSGVGPKIIHGSIPLPWDPWNMDKAIPWTNFDWHPSQEPYCHRGG